MFHVFDHVQLGTLSEISDVDLSDSTGLITSSTVSFVSSLVSFIATFSLFTTMGFSVFHLSISSEVYFPGVWTKYYQE